jgi:hypothetical protein
VCVVWDVDLLVRVDAHASTEAGGCAAFPASLLSEQATAAWVSVRTALPSLLGLRSAVACVAFGDGRCIQSPIGQRAVDAAADDELLSLFSPSPAVVDAAQRASSQQEDAAVLSLLRQVNAFSATVHWYLAVMQQDAAADTDTRVPQSAVPAAVRDAATAVGAMSDAFATLAPPSMMAVHSSVWAVGAQLLRANRCLDPPIRVLLRSVFGEAQRRQLRERIARHVSSNGKATLTLARNSWPVAQLHSAVVRALQAAGIAATGTNLRVEYALLSSSDSGKGINIHADSAYVLPDGVSKKSLAHAPFRTWGVSVMLSDPSLDFDDGDFHFFSAPAAALRLRPGDGALFTSGFESVHYVAPVSAVSKRWIAVLCE